MEIFLVWIVAAAIPAMIAAHKKRSFALWLLYGLAIWPIALVHALLIGSRRPGGGDRAPCPYCAEAILPEARICPHCRSELPLTALERRIAALEAARAPAQK